MSANYIHRVKNLSANAVQMIFLNPYDQRSYDLLIGSGQTVAYDAIYGEASAPVLGASGASFPKSHLRLQVGPKTHALYERDGKVRLCAGDAFDKDAPVIGGFAGPGPLELEIAVDSTVTGKAMEFATGPDLTAVSWANSRFAIYGTNAADGTLVQKAWLTSHWDTWTSIAGPAVGLRGQIASAWWAEYRYSVYAIGRDGLIYEKAWLTDRWEEWMQHPSPQGVAFRNLSAVRWETGRFGVYAVDENGGLYQKWWGTNKWHDWESLGRPDPISLVGPVTAVSWTGYRYGVYALGSDGQVWQKWYGGNWHGWDSIGQPGSRLRTLASASWEDRVYTVAGVAEDGNLWAKEYRHGWKKWENLGHPPNTSLSGAAAAISWRAGKKAYYVRGVNGVIYQLDGKTWTALDTR